MQTRTLLLAASMLLPAAARSQTVMLPAIPLPGGATVEGMLFQPDPAVASAAGYKTTGITFLQGSVPAGTHLQIKTNARGAISAAQLDEKTHWADGSVRTAVLTFASPFEKAAGAVHSYYIQAGGTSSASLTLGVFNPGVATVAITPSGGSPVVLDVAQMLATQTPTYWLQGPLATEGRVDQTIEGAFHVTIDVRVYANGTSQLDVTFANDLAMNKGKNETYTASIKLGSQTFNQTITAQAPFTNWHHVIYSTGIGPAGTLVHDMNVLEAAGMIPRYPLNVGVARSEISSELKTSYPCDALGVCAVRPYMGTTGGRPDIGLLPRWDAIVVQSYDAAAYRFMIVNGDASGSIPWHVELTAGQPVTITEPGYGHFWLDDRCSQQSSVCSPMSYQSAQNAADHGLPIQGASPYKGIQLDFAHQPGMAYLPYLLTGERYYLDEVTEQAGQAVTDVWPVVRQSAPGYADLLFGSAQQLRAAAWSARQLLYASLVVPDTSSLQAYFKTILNDNFTALVANANDPAKGEIKGIIDGFVDSGQGQFSAPMEDYLALVLEWANHAGFETAANSLGAMSNFLLGRFNQAPSVFSPYDGVAYQLKAGPNGSTWYTTWGAVEHATVAFGTSNTVTSFGPPPGTEACQDFGVTATSVVKGLPTSAAQQQAASFFVAHPDPCQNPAWVINP